MYKLYDITFITLLSLPYNKLPVSIVVSVIRKHVKCLHGPQE